jgi:hypothetical protein
MDHTKAPLSVNAPAGPLRGNDVPAMRQVPKEE